MYINTCLTFSMCILYTGVSKKRSKLKKQEESDGDDDEEVYVPKKQRFMENLYKQKEEELKAKKAKRSVVNVWGQGLF